MNLRRFILARSWGAAGTLFWGCCLAIAAAQTQSTAQAPAAGSVVELVTSGGDGASIQMAQDLASVVNDGATRRLLFTVGDGSVQNLIDLKRLNRVDLAIVQSDVLDYARRNKVVAGIETTLYVAKLHSQELHLLARGDVQKLEDLAGKKVAYSGGAAVTGPAVLDLLHVKVEAVVADPEVALAKLKSGEVAAFAYVAAKPTALFDGLGGKDGLHFLAITPKPEQAGAYVPGTLTAKEYPLLVAADAPVSTVAVAMVMVAANMTPATDRYRNVADFVDAFFTRLPRLQAAPHHPKWAEVDVGADLAGWKRIPAAELWLKRNAVAQAREEKKLLEAFLDERTRQAGGAPLSAQEKEQLFDQFRRWETKSSAAGNAAAPPAAMPAPASTGSEQRVAVATPPAPPAAAPQPGLKAPDTVPLPGGAILEMVPLPGGSFLMGSDEDASEKPIHRVAVAPFSIARYPVTVREWKECVAAGGCPEIAAGDDNAPMTNVSWDDAQRFVAWLTKATSQSFRLPSEAEWEYAARAGTQTRYWWGNDVPRGAADCKGCGETYDPRHPLKVGAFPPNPFGLHDMTGTVAEWVADCWHRSYRDAPAVNTPWDGGDCQQHVLRGGSWQNDPSYLRAASRDAYDTSVRYVTHGFRVARSDQPTEILSQSPSPASPPR